MSESIILIPARYGSQRFPGKPLAKINGKEMIHYVIENCESSGLDYAVVTDSPEIESFISSIKGNVVRVDDDVSTGSERIALAYERFYKSKGHRYIINVQGDEPLLSGKDIKRVADIHKHSSFDVVTAVKRRSSESEMLQDSNVVKCVFSELDNKCLYFSRSPIPYSRSSAQFDWFQHIGVYSYTAEELCRFVKLKESRLESLEKLEQLRILENGSTIGACELEVELLGVDVPEDIMKVERSLSE